MTPTVVYRLMKGLGDNIFQRAFVRTLAEAGKPVHLVTPWPELYDDLPAVRFMAEDTPLRTQRKNVVRQNGHRWSAWPNGSVSFRTIAYGAGCLRHGSIVDAMRQRFGVQPAGWNLPAFPRFEHPDQADRPIAVIRPVTERKEWYNSARSPRPEYVAELAELLMRDHFVVSVADVDGVNEWMVGPVPPAHVKLEHGELTAPELLGLIQTAALVVGGVGWIVPACIAAGTPLFCLLGGQGGHNAPEKITDKTMDLSHVGFARPDRFCRCENMRHDCDKANSRLLEQWNAWRATAGV